MSPKRVERVALAFTALCGLAAHEGDWVGAVDLAKDLAMPWRPLAFTLRRLASRGIVQEEVFVVRGTARTKEEVRRYRLGTGCSCSTNPLLPRPHPIPPGIARRITGRAGVSR